MDTKKSHILIKPVSVDGEGSISSATSPQPSWWKRFLRKIEIDTGSRELTRLERFLYNYDLRPVEEERRQWSWYNYVFFWVADSFNVNTWQIAATGVVAGMTWWQTWISVWLGYFITGCFVSLSARPGIFNHISFPVFIRQSFGIFGSLWPILNRVVMSCVWYSVQAWIGGQCVRIMLEAIFGTDLNERIGGVLPGQHTDSLGMLSFFLFWFGSLPFLWFPPHKVRHLFTVKSYVIPFAGFGFMIWSLVKAHGAGSVIYEKSTLKGSKLGWAFVSSTMNCLANFATLILNAPDFSRFANKPSKAIKYWVYIGSIPICFSVTCLIGILVSSASKTLYGEALWNPLEVLEKFLQTSWTSGTRAGAFLIAFAFTLAQLGTNISANSLSFGTDVTAMLPGYINIRRGSFMCAAFAYCICPWQLMSSSSKFTSVLSAYSVFLSSIIGVVACDYYIIRRGYLDLHHLFSLNLQFETEEVASYYKYFKGVNWRAFVAYLCGMAPNMPGFVGATGLNVSDGATKVYILSFPVGFLVSASIYYLLVVWVSPLKVGIAPEVNLKGWPHKQPWLEEWKQVEDFESELLDDAPELLFAVKSAQTVAGKPSHNDIGNLVTPITSFGIKS
ncbi:Allantoin permease [Wickerhamiella sorbophila]|uniref:Allantoin permease n=1 Tax=Wickerhamiella sorbophila TaxID=45607 RepID=A0A2T0FDC1_9ASCO|nr:Allantoin permease [Wickerhamiella sorbophila]PRT53008.1 Allantoin permease [Wickerhamiella sorbophila]